MKKILVIFGLLFTFALTCLCVQAKGNYLHSVTLERNSEGYNVIFNTDKITKVVRKAVSDNELVLELSGITSADTVNALYKGTSNIDNLVIENTDSNKLRVYITAPDIRNSSVIIEPEDGIETLVNETFPTERVLWCGFVLLAFAVMFKIAKNVSEQDSKILIKKDIKDREIELYRKYKKCFDTNMNVTSIRDMRMKNMLKKIDRKIDERLTAVR